MKKTELKRIFEESFGFLITDYGFILVSSKSESWGYKLVAKNATTGIEIIDEFREAYIEIILYRLVGGEIINNVNDAIRNGEPILGFGLGWVIKLKNPDDQIKPVYEYGLKSPFYDENNGRKNYTEFVASKLKEYASDIISGDFSSFPTLDTMVKEYWKEYQKSHGK